MYSRPPVRRPRLAPLLLLTALPAAPARPTHAAPPVPCPAAITFCRQTLSPNTTQVTCYERSGTGPDVPALDLAPLACLPTLQNLTLASGEIEFILPLKLGPLTPLASLPLLTRLVLEESPIDDLAPLASLVRLQHLSIHHSHARDLRPLARLTDLRDLDLSCTQVTDLTPLQSLQSLQKLDLTATPVRDLRPLFALPQLTWLGLSPDAAIPAPQLAALKARHPRLTITPGRRY